MIKAVGLFILTAAAITSSWSWLGMAKPMPPSPLDRGEKLYCVSYAPFRGAQSPLDLSTSIAPEQIDQDLAQLAKLTSCIRTYSVDFGLERVPEIAQRHGLKVLLGLWVSSHADRTDHQLRTGIALAKRFPDVIRAVVVGNEALLRGEVSPERLAGYLRDVKSQSALPVTYADVWEFWLKNRSLAEVADFVTVHILPYWEDEPISAIQAVDHIDDIRKRVVESFPGKEIVIGEVGWPSAGRMREGALPSPANQALVLSDILARGKREGFRVNLIEAFDQPWKRYQEGTVGGHWGMFEDATRRQKFAWGEPVSDHRHWRWQAMAGVLFAALIFGAGFLAEHRMSTRAPMLAWMAIALIAFVGGVLIGWTIESLPLESLGWGGWIRSLALTTLALGIPVVVAVALVCGRPIPAFDQVMGPPSRRTRDRLSLILGAAAVALAVLALQSALALAFDPRYRDFPFAPLTAAAVPFVMLSLVVPQPPGRLPIAELVAAGTVVLCAVFVAWNETLANWQSLWFCGALLLVAISLTRVRAAPGRG
jgi:exo-beta-1,3-glucanase (GH17 family)